MKLPLSRLSDFLETNASLDDIVNALNNLGLEVEGVENPAETLGHFTVGKIISAEQHPNADRLRVCQVKTFEGTVQIVCGAPNARAGINVCVSLPGMYIPGLDIKIKKGKIRDVESCGMLCSITELGLEGEDHGGILELPEIAKIGEKVIDILGVNDPIIDISITPNRPDALGVYGIAHDLAAAGLGTLKPLEIPELKTSFNSPISLSLQHSESCPHFVGYYIKNVKVGQSPEYIKRFLKAMGCKSINAPVDITNYLCYSFARPLHVFDADKIGKNITARLAENGEIITALDEENYTLTDTDIVIADENAPQAIAGVMGGLESGVYEHTVNIFLESAYFNPDYISATGRRLNILSDARYRFERGISPAFAEDGAKIAAQMIVDLCGGEISYAVIAGKPALPDTAYHLSHDTVQNLTGVEIDFAKQEKILRALGFTIINQGKKLICVPPANRPDIKGEADLVEEIIRIYGINHVKAQPLPPLDVKTEALSPKQKRIEKLRNFASSRSLLEAVTYSFMEKSKAELFLENGNTIDLANPISSDLSTMRPSIVCGLLSAVSRNHARGFKNNALFEIGRVFHGIADDVQPQYLGIVKTGNLQDQHWSSAAKPYDIYDIKADMLAVLENMGIAISGLNIISDGLPSYYHPGRSGIVKLGKAHFATFGELHPKVAKAFDISSRVMITEIKLDDIPLPKVKKSTALSKAKIHDLQSVNRDFAFVLDQSITSESLLRAVRKSEKKLITDVSIFDIFTGGNLQENQKSVALRVTLQPLEKSLNDTELSQIMDNIISEVLKIGGELRA